MDTQLTQNKISQKKVISIVAVACLILALAEAILILFMPILSVSGKNYVGWQVAYYYWGKQYIYHYHEFGFNAVLASSQLISILLIAVTLIRWRKSGDKARSIMQFLVAAALIYFAFAFMSALSLAEGTASTTMYNTIYYAKNANEYKLAAFPTINLVVCLILAAAQLGTGIQRLMKKKTEV